MLVASETMTRFHARVARCAHAQPCPTCCHEWQGLLQHRRRYGSGNWRAGGRRETVAHRLAWMLHHDRLPTPGMVIAHTCDNPPCCNPAHLYETTALENTVDIHRVRQHKRPVNKETALVARVPLDLYDAVRQHAEQHGFTISHVVRDSLARFLGRPLSPTPPPDAMEVSAAVRQAIERYVDQAVQDAVDSALQPIRQRPPTGRRPRQPIPPAPGQAPPPPSDVSYDPTRFYLAPLCKRGHDWQGTGQSLLRRQNSNCVQCQRELRRARAARPRRRGSLPKKTMKI
jgi:hypothetical protein